MSVSPKVGIVVPTLNRITKTERFIECLAEQSFQNFHLYVIDSGSKDGTRELVSAADIPATLIEATLDHWWSAATNLGVKRALAEGCDLILTINDDAIIASDYLEQFVEVFMRRNLKICANRIDFADEPGKVWALGSYSIWGSPYLFQLKFNGYWFDELPSAITDHELYEAMAVCGDGVLVHRDVFEEIGFYQEKFAPQVHGDSEFVMRAKRHGIDAFVATQVILYNDIYNLSEDEVPEVDTRSNYELFKELFFFEKSDLYWRPVFYIVRSYAPRGWKLNTLAKYYLYKIYIFFVPPFLERDANRPGWRARRSLVTRLKQRISSWAFTLDGFESDTLRQIADDERQYRQLEAVSRRLQY